MNWIKKITKAFLTLILINLFILLAISFNLKKIIIDGVIKETITQRITKKDQQEENFIITEETINQITDDERVKEVCKVVGLDHFIKTLPKGYNSEISDANNCINKVSSDIKKAVAPYLGICPDCIP